MTNFDEKDRSILRCTIKKSTSTAIALGKIAICIVAIVALCFGIFKLWGILGDPVHSLLTVVFSLLVAVPWWAYAIVGGIGAIILHSFLWCIAREVTPEAYADKRVNNVVNIMAMLSVIGCGVVPIVSGIICNLLYASDAALLSAVLTFLAMGCLTMLLISSWDPSTSEGEVRNNPSSTYKFFRFLTAYYYMVTDPKPAAMLCDPPYSGTTAASTDYEKTK